MHVIAHGAGAVCTPEQSLRWMLTLGEKSLPHRGLEPTSVLHLAFRSDAIPTELPLPQDKTAREFSPRVSSECRALSADCLTVFMHTLCAITHHLCPLWNVPNPWQPYHCLDTWKHSTHYINPSKMEQGCLNCRGTENNDMQNFSPEKQVYFLSKRGMQKRNNWKCTRYLEDFFLFSFFFFFSHWAKLVWVWIIVSLLLTRIMKLQFNPIFLISRTLFFLQLHAQYHLMLEGK